MNFLSIDSYMSRITIKKAASPSTNPSASQQSNLFLTINTDKVDSGELKKHLEHTILEFLKNLGVFLVYRGTQDPCRIEKIDTQYTIEVGGKMHRVHSHVLLSIHHTMKAKGEKIEVNLTRLRKFLNTRLGTNVYLNASFRGDDKSWMSHYLSK
jgi:hypothetical protein